MSELKPCPFCEGKAYEVMDSINGGVTYCDNCDASAFIGWNSRPIEEAQALRIKELEDKLAMVKESIEVLTPGTWASRHNADGFSVIAIRASYLRGILSNTTNPKKGGA